MDLINRNNIFVLVRQSERWIWRSSLLWQSDCVTLNFLRTGTSFFCPGGGVFDDLWSERGQKIFLIWCHGKEWNNYLKQNYKRLYCTIKDKGALLIVNKVFPVNRLQNANNLQAKKGRPLRKYWYFSIKNIIYVQLSTSLTLTLHFTFGNEI